MNKSNESEGAATVMPAANEEPMSPAERKIWAAGWAAALRPTAPQPPPVDWSGMVWRACEPAWRDMASAPLDNTLVRLLVKFDNHAIEDTQEPTATIGAHNDGEWSFVGWDWYRDTWTRGSGDLLGWLPMLGQGYEEAANWKRWCNELEAALRPALASSVPPEEPDAQCPHSETFTHRSSGGKELTVCRECGDSVPPLTPEQLLAKLRASPMAQDEGLS